MSNPSSIVTSLCLIGAGVVAWAGATRMVASNEGFDAPLNVMGINRSPYGEVFAMAMQGPIDSTFHRGATDLYGASHVQDSVEDARGEIELNPKERPVSQNLRSRFRDFITDMAAASTERTNPTPTSKAHDLFIRRQVEDKLRFAYQLDPSHYGNYNSYHFFLTEPQMGTRPELTPGAAKLADDTIRYCLSESRDPRPALTAAAAACNVLHLMFADQKQEQPKFTAPQMRQTLSLLDHCIARHHQLFHQWNESGEIKEISAMRLIEMETRLSFVEKIRDAASTTVERFEKETSSESLSTKS